MNDWRSGIILLLIILTMASCLCFNQYNEFKNREARCKAVMEHGTPEAKSKAVDSFGVCR